MDAIHVPGALVNATAHKSARVNGDAWVDACEDDTPSYQYAGVANIFKTMSRFEGDGFKVTGVPPTARRAIWKYRDKNRPKVRLSYLADEDPPVLLVVIPTRGHEYMQTGLTSYLRDQAHQMGISILQLQPAAAATYPQIVNGVLRGEGEGDATFVPGGVNQGWPSLVVEVGYSQSLHSLQAKARWWFTASEHRVKIVLLVKYFRARRSIVLQKWVEVDVSVQVAYPGVMTRAGRAASSGQGSAQEGATPTIPRMVRDQLITISLEGNMNASNPGSFSVARSPLVLGFRDVMLREPRGQEGDFVFSESVLQEYAAFVWIVMGNRDAAV